MSQTSLKRPNKCRKLLHPEKTVEEKSSKGAVLKMEGQESPATKWNPILATWEEKLLAEVFRVSLHPKIASALQVEFLEDLAAEIKSSQKLCSLQSPGFFDRVLLAAAQHVDGDFSSYMLDVYENAVQFGKNASSSQKQEERTQALKVARQSLVSYLALTCPEPTMWGFSEKNPPLQPYEGFLKALKGGKLQPGFLEHLLDHLTENDEVSSFFGPVFQMLYLDIKSSLEEASAMKNIQMLLGAINSVSLLTANKRLCAVLVGMPCWDSDGVSTGKDLQTQCFLGAIFSLEPSRACYKRTGFPESEDLVARVGNWSREGGQESDGEDEFVPTPGERKELADAQNGGRNQLRTLHMALHQVLRNLLKEKSSQEATLQWLGKVVSLNTDRTKSGVQHGLSEAATSTPGFLYNIVSVLLLMCEPFLNLSDPKAKKMMGKIDMEYFLDNQRFSIKGETRLAMSPAESNEEGEVVVGSDRWLDQRNLARIQQFQQRQEALVQSANPTDSSPQKSHTSVGPKQYGTITEYFALTSRAVYVGPLQTIHQMKKNERKMKDLKRHKKQLLSMLQNQQNGPFRTAQIKQTLGKLQEEMDEAIMLKLNGEMTLMHPEFIHPCLQFLRLQGRLILRDVTSVQDQQSEIPTLPLAVPPPPVFAALPSQVVECLPDFILFVCYNCPGNPRTGSNMLVDSTAFELQDLLTFIVSFIGSAMHLRNPYLRAKLVESLQALCPETYVKDEKKLHELFETHQLAMNHLAPLLLQFFVDIEFTGSHTQFYDKFNYRSITSRLLKYLWQLPAYQESVIRYSQDRDSFVRFANMMVNDSIYHMDESLKYLTEIKEHETKMGNTAEWQSKTDEERQEIERMHEQAGQQVRWSLREANQLLQMMNYMSEKIVDPFMVEEMINRIAEMLNYFLDYLVGPKSLQLKVKDMEKYDWKPIEVLLMLIGAYINFSPHEPFADAVARDIRSYNRKHFLKAIEILQRPQIQSSHSISASKITDFQSFADHAEKCWVAYAQEDEELGEDIPEEFLCPISCELMKDPVILPSSGVVCDRPSIARSLLSDEIDPFNRTYLTLKDIQPNDDLKKKIKEWREQQKKMKVSGELCTNHDEASLGAEELRPSASFSQTFPDQTKAPHEESNTSNDLKIDEDSCASKASRERDDNLETQSVLPPPPPGAQEENNGEKEDDLLQQAILMSLSSENKTEK